MSVTREGSVYGRETIKPESGSGLHSGDGMGTTSITFRRRSFLSRSGVIAVLAMTAALLSACASSEPDITPPDAGLPVGFHDVSEVITAKAGDRLKVVAFGLDALTGDYVVDAAGALDLGRYGKVHVAGLTYPQIEEKIAARLSAAGEDGIRISVLPDNG